MRVIHGGEYGTAAALLRPLAEASSAPYWLIYAASDEAVLKLPSDPDVENADDDLPQLKTMVADLLPYFPDMQGIFDGLSPRKGGTARWLHKYTHGGTPQLVRRSRSHSWDEHEVAFCILRANMFVSAAINAEIALCPNDRLDATINDAMSELFCELQTTFGLGKDVDRARKPLPTTDKRCCGAALPEIGARSIWDLEHG